MKIPVVSIRTSRFVYADDELTNYLTQCQLAGEPMHVALTSPQKLELRGGKVPIPGAQPYDVSTEGVPIYSVGDLGWNEQTQQRENADVNEVGGAPELRGQFAQAPANKRAEVIDFDPTMRWAYINVPLNYPDGHDARLHPHSLAGWVAFNSLRPLPTVTKSPFRRKTL